MVSKVKVAQQLKQSTHTDAGWCPGNFESRVNGHGTGLEKHLCRDSCNLIFWMRKYEGTWHRHFFHSYQRSNEFSWDEFGKKSGRKSSEEEREKTTPGLLDYMSVPRKKTYIIAMLLWEILCSKLKMCSHGLVWGWVAAVTLWGTLCFLENKSNSFIIQDPLISPGD